MIQQERKQNARPNIIWIFGDQHRAQAMGYNGDPNVHTPNFDRFAAENAVLDGAVGGCPLCCPYRGSLISGLYPHRAVPGHEYPLDPKLPTVATAFNDAGYHTAYYGKWHLDGFKERTGRAAFHLVPPERRGGFKTWVGYENNNSQYDCWVHGGGGGSDLEPFHYRLPGYETDALTDLLIDYIKERGRLANAVDAAQAKPFFAVLSVQPPHGPYLGPAEWMQRHTPGKVVLRPNVPHIPRIETQARRDLAGYYAMIENLDWNFGRIQDALEKQGLLENTYLLFFSDHGDMHGSHGLFQKTNPYEESIRVPFIMGHGRSIYNGKAGRKRIPINHVDLAPTSLGLCGLPIPEWMQGTDYSGCYQLGKPEPTEPDSAYLQLCIPTGHGNSIGRPWRGLVTRDGWKYVCLEGQPWLLFDLNEDPYEQVNMALNPKYDARRRALQQRLAQWIEDTGDCFKLPE